MLDLVVIQAEEGDCLLLRHGGDGSMTHTLIDGGPRGTFEKSLRPALRALGVSEMDVLLSHVDEDHVGGLLELFAALRDERDDPPQDPAEALGLTVMSLWHNAFSALDPARRGRLQRALAGLPAGSGALSSADDALLSIAQGDRLATLGDRLGVPRNPGLGLAFGAGVALPWAGVEARVVGPTQANLDALRAKWDAWIEKVEADHAAMSDRSVPNLSSLQLLVTHGAGSAKKTLLLTGDGRGDHLLEALEEQSLLGADGTMHVDVLKVPHHGSERNVTPEFFRRVQAKTYVISANGKHDNPDIATLRWIIDAAGQRGEDITLFVTNPRPSAPLEAKKYALDALRELRPQAKHGYTIESLDVDAGETHRVLKIA